MSLQPTNVPRQIVVVLVEDDFLVRMTASDALQDAGLTVLLAEHADGALAHLITSASEVHALFTDVHMPGSMNGLQLAHHVQSRWPHIGLVITSGDFRPSAAELPFGSRFLQKPYRYDHVLNHVREVAALR